MFYFRYGSKFGFSAVNQSVKKSTEKKWIEEKKKVMKLGVALKSATEKRDEASGSLQKKLDEMNSVNSMRDLELEQLKKNFEKVSTVCTWVSILIACIYLSLPSHYVGPGSSGK